MQGLEGMKVLELGHMVSAAYAAKLMADLCAEVIKVEELGGDWARQRGPFPGGARTDRTVREARRDCRSGGVAVF